MSHPVSSLHFRVGKLLPWYQSGTLVNQDSSLDQSLNQLLLQKNCYGVKIVLTKDNLSTIVNILYYPMFSSINAIRSSNYFNLQKVNKLSVQSRLLEKSWNISLKAPSRFKSAKKQILLKQQLLAQASHKLSKFNKLRLANTISKRLGTKVKLQCLNIFKYLYSKRKLNIKNLLSMHFNSRYRRDSKVYRYYHDLINSFFIVSASYGSNALVIFLVQQSLYNIHISKVKPKKLFYFLDKVIKNMSEVQKNFKAYHIAITGKLRGGTARTGNFSVGFGPLTKQTISANDSMLFGTVKSTYGSFGVKILSSSNQTSSALNNIKVSELLLSFKAIIVFKIIL